MLQTYYYKHRANVKMLLIIVNDLLIYLGIRFFE